MKSNDDTVVMCWKGRQGKNGYISRDQPIMLLFLPIMLCAYAVVLLKFTYHAQYYAQEQELLSDYYAFYMRFCIRNSLHVAENLRLFY